MDQIAIGARIKAARERVHLTQEQLAEIIDISPTHMSVIERGVKTPKLDTFVRIANALGVSTDALAQIVRQLAAKAGNTSSEFFQLVHVDDFDLCALSFSALCGLTNQRCGIPGGTGTTVDGKDFLHKNAPF